MRLPTPERDTAAREPFGYTESRHGRPMAPRDGGITAMHLGLLIAVFPATVVWYPVVQSPTFGNLTAGDVVLGGLWLTTLAIFLRERRFFPADPRLGRALLICSTAAGISVCFLLGAFAFDASGRLLPELLAVKRFGLSSVIPLALCVARHRRLFKRVALSALAATVVMVLPELFSFGDLLPSHQLLSREAISVGERSIGTITNPNDFAYIGVLGIAIALWLMRQSARGRALSFLLVAVAIASGLWAVFSSASRSGVAALAVMSIYTLLRARWNPAQKFLALAALSILAFVASQSGSSYQSRMSAAWENGGSESDVASRLEAQEVAIRAWLTYPLGVGSLNLPAATLQASSNAVWFTSVGGSDSVYVDTLLGGGIFGITLLLSCFACCWRMAEPAPRRGQGVCLRAGLLGMMCAGLATVSPASVFVAPFFFVTAGLGGCPPPPSRFPQPRARSQEGCLFC